MLPRRGRLTFEDVACAPAANFHDDAFSDSRPAQVARGSAAQAVEEQAGNAGEVGRLGPRITEIPDCLAIEAGEDGFVRLN